jgi:hypothetical protein
MGVERREIMEVKTFVDAAGREVKEFSQVFGKEKIVPFYKGLAVMVVQARRPDGIPLPPREQRVEFPFPDGTTLKKAFEDYDAIAKKEMDDYIKRLNEKAAANRVVPVSGVAPILGADGKPAMKLELGKS